MATEKLKILIETAFRGQGAKQARRELDTLDKSATKSRLSLGQLTMAAGAVTAGLAAAAFAAKQAWDALKAGADLELTAVRFERLSASINTTADALLGKMKRATRGMISDAELMSSANDIIRLGLSDTEGDVVRLATVIGKLGWNMNQVIQTFANDSIMRLDALGFQLCKNFTK